MNDKHQLAKVLESTAVVRFQDCDPFGHLNNARYIDYFLNARQDQLQQYYDFHLWRVDQPMTESWVVTRNQIAYLAPARLMEEILVRTQLLGVSERRLLVEGQMFDREATHIKAIIWMEFAYVNLKTGRPVDHPEELMQLFHAVLLDDEIGIHQFENRVQTVKAVARRLHAEPA